MSERIELELLREEVEHLRRQRDELQAMTCIYETERRAPVHTEAYFEQFGIRYPERLVAFTKRMAAKLDANGHKGDWRSESIGRLYDLLCEEMHELTDALRCGDSDEHVILECIDVASFAFFIADVVENNGTMPK